MAKITMMSAILALFVLFFAILSFIFGLVAFLKTPEFGTPVINKDGVTCKFSNDPVVIFGYLSVAFLVGSAMVGCLSLFYPFKGKSVLPRFSSIFSSILTFIGLATAASLLWATISIHLLQHKVHHDLNYACPSAGTSEVLVIGSLFSLVLGIIWSCMVLAREDLFHEVNDVNGGET